MTATVRGEGRAGRAQRAPADPEALGLSLSDQSCREGEGEGPGEWVQAYSEGQRLEAFRARLSNMRRTIITAADQFDDLMRSERKRFHRVLVTFTYSPEVKPAPGQLRDCLRLMRRWVERQGAVWRACWVLEFHRSGRPHYHLAVWLPARLRLPMPDKRGWWPHGATNIARAGRGGVKRAGAYLAKYISKGCELAACEAYRGQRSYAIAGLDWARRMVIWYWRLPAWLADVADPALIEGRAQGGRRIGGRVYLSPYEWSGGRIRRCEWTYDLERAA